MTKGILNSMKTRDRIYKSFLRSKDPAQKAILKKRFKTYRNKIVTLCRISKTEHYKHYFKPKKCEENMERDKPINQSINQKNIYFDRVNEVHEKIYNN